MGYTPPYLEVRKAAGVYNIYGPSSTTTDDIKLFGNTTDTVAAIEIQGAAGIKIYHATASTLKIYDNTTAYLSLSYATPDSIIQTGADDKNLFLKTSGTGVIKFGSYTAGAATDSTGYISILDAAGNARKLMVQA